VVRHAGNTLTWRPGAEAVRRRSAARSARARRAEAGRGRAGSRAGAREDSAFAEQREYEGIEARILAAEERKAALESTSPIPPPTRGRCDRPVRLRAELEELREVDRLYARWQELEALRA